MYVCVKLATTPGGGRCTIFSGDSACVYKCIFLTLGLLFKYLIHCYLSMRLAFRSIVTVY